MGVLGQFCIFFSNACYLSIMFFVDNRNIIDSANYSEKIPKKLAASELDPSRD